MRRRISNLLSSNKLVNCIEYLTMQYLTNANHKYLFLDRKFLENTFLRARITTPLREIEHMLYTLEWEATKGAKIFDELVERCFQLISRVPIPTWEVQVPFLVRARKGFRDNNGNIFSNVGDLSYCPVNGFISAGRFNMNKEPVFYACPPSESLNSTHELTAILESYKDVITRKDEVFDRYVTLSRWDIKRPFWVVNLAMFDVAETKNKSARKLNRRIYNAVRRVFSPESLYILRRVSSYISEKAGKKLLSDQDYLITNAFKKACERYYGKAIMGFVYSSSITENTGLNLALSKELVDDRTIDFKIACVYKIKTHPLKPSKILDVCSNFASPDAYGNLNLKVNSADAIFG
jgi:hypothetical protein